MNAARPDIKVLSAILLCSASALAFEVSLTRIFSISLWHHFAFMIISIGMLGIGLSGTLQSIHPALRRRSRLGLYALMLAVTVPISYMLSNLVPFDPVRLQWDGTQLARIGIYYVLLSMPFFFFGLVVATAFGAYSEYSGLLYGSDLIGASMGALFIIPVIGILGPERALLAISLSALLGAFLLGRRIASALLGLCLIGLLVANPSFMKLRMSPYKELSQALMYPGAEHIRTYNDGYSRVDAFRSPLVRFAPGLSLTYMKELPPQTGLSVDGSGITAITRWQRRGDRGNDALDFLEHLPSSLPYELKNGGTALVIEPRGGLQALMARHSGFGPVAVIEPNPLMAEVVQSDFAEFSGEIYKDNMHRGLARSWLKRQEVRFDVIDFARLGSLPSGGFGIDVDYGVTTEAFVQYLSHLTENGVLSLSAYILPPPRTELRLLNVAVDALRALGIKDPSSCIAAIRSWGTITILVKIARFEQEEIERIRDFSRANMFDLVYYPGMAKEEAGVFIESPSGQHHEAFMRLLSPEGRRDFMDDYLFDISPADDDKPFFAYHLKTSNIKAIYEVMDRKWQYFMKEGYLLPAILLQAAALSAALIVLPLLLRKGQAMGGAAGLVYFALLGLGFMFIEMPLIQKMILPFENPSRSVAIVLAAVLVCSGAGSIMGQRHEKLASPFVMAALAAVSALYGLFLSSLADWMSQFPMWARVGLVFLLILPAGLLMGIPFPMGMKALGRRNPALIPWAWAVNGYFSVIAPVAAAMTALWVGFRGVFLAGAVLYALALIFGLKTIFLRR